jgi:hypothetical protein
MGLQFVSYPKSGRSWVRFVLHEAGVSEQINFQHDGFEFNDGARPTHNYDLTVRLEKYDHDQKVVFLTREPRDVLVSLYHQVTGRFKDIFSYEGPVSDFIRDDYFGAGPLKKFNDMWEFILTKRHFLKISYEDCHRDLRGSVENILGYYNLTCTREDIDRGVAAGSFENMKSVEDDGQFHAPWLRRRNDSPKVRTGRVGGFRDTLSDEDIAYLDSVFNPQQQISAV